MWNKHTHGRRFEREPKWKQQPNKIAWLRFIGQMVTIHLSSMQIFGSRCALFPFRTLLLCVIRICCATILSFELYAVFFVRAVCLSYYSHDNLRSNELTEQHAQQQSDGWSCVVVISRRSNYLSSPRSNCRNTVELPEKTREHDSIFFKEGGELSKMNVKHVPNFWWNLCSSAQERSQHFDFICLYAFQCA